MKLTDNALTVLKKRYLIKDVNGNPTETPRDLFRRVARSVAAADAIYNKAADIKATEEKFYELMSNLDFLPNSPTLMNAGRPLGQLSACFVLPIEDSMEEIFETIKNAAIIHKSGGGTGFSFSRIRPSGSTVNTTGGVASGPISFMKVFNSATEAVKQGGTRRGANMGILRVDHPDILEFIACKQNNSEITNFNISVGITEKFMEAAKDNKDYDLIDPHTKKAVKKLNAKEVFDLIVKSAWQNGEPGIIFLDRLNKDNVVPTVAEIESTNPCGEQPLLPYESCNLGSVNLANMVKTVSDKCVIDYEKLEYTVSAAVHFLDNVIDVNKYPLEIIDKTTKDTRKVGLGVMGFADMLFMLKVSYCSDKAVKIAADIMQFIKEKATAKSIELAKERGAFPLFEKSIFKGKTKIRNATLTTIAPTGTLSIIAGVSSGIEPVFALSYIRNVMDNTELLEVNRVFEKVLKGNKLYSKELMRSIAQTGSLHSIDLPDSIKKVFVTAHDVSPTWHIKMQAAFQRFTDNAVSKTVNFKAEATSNDVAQVFELAYSLGCKGVTIYRDGSRDAQVLNIGKVKGSEAKETSRVDYSVKKIVPRPRPSVTTGFTEKVKIGCGNLYITVNYDENGICEVFTNTGRGGGCPSQSEATSRLVSIALRAGLDADSIIEQLKGIRCMSTIRQKDIPVKSCPDAIARVIEKVMKLQNGHKPVETVEDKEDESIDDLCIDCSMKFVCSKESCTKKCPECGSEVEHEGGCMVCRNCGYSKCG